MLAKFEIGLNTYYLNEEDGWQPDLDDIKKDHAADARDCADQSQQPHRLGLYRKILEQVAELARRHNLIVFADEIYDKLIIDDDPHVAMAAVAPDLPVITFGGLPRITLPRDGALDGALPAAKLPLSSRIWKAVNKLLRARLAPTIPSSTRSSLRSKARRII